MIIVCSSAKTFRKAKKGSSVPLFIDDAKHMVSKLVFMAYSLSRSIVQTYRLNNENMLISIYMY